MISVEDLFPIFRGVFDDDKLVVSEATTASDIKDWDSLAHVNLVVAIEQRFGVRFALGELQGLKNVGGMLELINRKLGPK